MLWDAAMLAARKISACQMLIENIDVCALVEEMSKKALVFQGKEDVDGKREKEREEEEQERKEEGEKDKGVLTPALVILQQTAERGLKSSDAQLEGNRVERDMVNILVRGLDGKHLSMKIAGGTRVSALCVDLAKSTGIPQCLLFDSAGKGTADRG